MTLNLPNGHWPPGGWQYLDPKTGYRELKPIERDKMEVANAILAMRRNNRAHYPPNTATLEASIAELELYTARRLFNKGLKQYVVTSIPAPPVTVKKKLEAVVAARPAARSNWFDQLKNIAGGVATLADWVGHGQQTIDQAKANARASICLSCPKNQKTGLIGSIVSSIANAIQSQTELKNHLKLSTPSDEKLHTCSACDCHLPLKVWVPIITIKKHLDPEVYVQLDPNCWILRELQT
jgi:hypothetical protein